MMNQLQTPARWIMFGGVNTAAIALLSTSLLMTSASAQSGTKGATKSGNPAPRSVATGSGSKVADNTVGLQGYCPVCIIEMKKWIKGDPQFAAQHDGKTYLFPGEEQKQMFLKSPAKYTPALGGDCVVALVQMGKRVAGTPQYSAFHNGRLYLFTNEQAKGMFLADTKKYANADLALGGKCTVCRIEMNKDVDGLPQFTSIYQGLRYRFPGDEQQQMFNQNPAKYRVTK